MHSHISSFNRNLFLKYDFASGQMREVDLTGALHTPSKPQLSSLFLSAKSLYCKTTAYTLEEVAKSS